MLFLPGLAATGTAALIAAEELMEEYPERRIIIVDSLSASLGQGLLVYMAQKKKEEGQDLDAVAEWAGAA